MSLYLMALNDVLTGSGSSSGGRNLYTEMLVNVNVQKSISFSFCLACQVLLRFDKRIYCAPVSRHKLENYWIDISINIRNLCRAGNRFCFSQGNKNNEGKG